MLTAPLHFGHTTLYDFLSRQHILHWTRSGATKQPKPQPGLQGRIPYFWQSQFYFFTLYTMSEKYFLKLNLDFVVAEIRGVYGSVYACVCVNRDRGCYCF